MQYLQRLSMCVRSMLMLAASLVVAACGGSDLSCGAGTVESGGQCIAAAPAAAPTLTKARLTFLNVKYDVAKPVLLNNSVPIRFGITSASADPSKPVTTAVNVVFSFVEAAPADPANPKTCDSNGIILKLVGNGVEQQFDADIFPTTDCAAWVGTGATANLAVDFDRGLRLSNQPTGIDYPPVVFSSALASAADNAVCKKGGNGAAGCVYALALAPTPVGADGKTPLVDVKLDSLTPESSVAVVWATPEDPDVPKGAHETDPPSLVVNAVFTMQGRDPYKKKIDPAKLPPELVAADPTIANDLKFGMTDAELNAIDDLPGAAVVRYEMAPSNKVSAGAWLPLAIDDPASVDSDGHVAEVPLREIQPGADNATTHELFIEGATRDAFAPGGVWASEDDFTVRGCLVASFPEAGNAGDESGDQAPVGGNVAGGDCKTFKVRLVKAAPPPTSASAHSFDASWARTAGNAERVALIGTLRTGNSLDLNGARTETEGTVEIKGRVGSDFGVQLFRAFAKGGALTTTASSYVDVGIDAFGVNLFGHQNTSADQKYEQAFTVAKSFQFPGLAFGFGPVSIGITAGVGGNVGLTPSITVSAKEGGEASVSELAQATSNGMIQTAITPNVGLNGNVTGGIDLTLAKAAVVATVQIVDIGFPLAATVRWGVTEVDAANNNAVKKITVLGTLTWDLTINWLNVSVDAVGRIGLGFFSISKTFNIWTYQNPQEKQSLLNRALVATVLE